MPPKKSSVTDPKPKAVKKSTKAEVDEAQAILVGFINWLRTQPHPQKDAASPGDAEPTADKETPHEPDQT